jgi:hypothetical protein
MQNYMVVHFSRRLTLPKRTTNTFGREGYSKNGDYYPVWVV